MLRCQFIRQPAIAAAIAGALVVVGSLAGISLVANSHAATPSTQPDDPTMDWILSHATTLPATPSAHVVGTSSTEPGDSAVRGDSSNLAKDVSARPDESAGPATLPAVLKSLDPSQDESRAGAVALSNGKTIVGRVSTTARQPVRVWVARTQQYEDLPFSLIQRVEVRVISETQEPEWKFAQGGSDRKEYSGRTYPARQTDYAFTLNDGTTVTGSVAAPIYVESLAERNIFILHKRDKGDPGQTLDQLVYVREINLKN